MTDSRRESKPHKKRRKSSMTNQDEPEAGHNSDGGFGEMQRYACPVYFIISPQVTNQIHHPLQQLPRRWPLPQLKNPPNSQNSVMGSRTWNGPSSNIPTTTSAVWEMKIRKASTRQNSQRNFSKSTPRVNTAKRQRRRGKSAKYFRWRKFGIELLR